MTFFKLNRWNLSNSKGRFWNTYATLCTFHHLLSAYITISAFIQNKSIKILVANLIVEEYNIAITIFNQLLPSIIIYYPVDNF